MKIINGTYTSAAIFAENIEDYALAQIQMLLDNPAFAGSKVRIMPDVHPGKVGTIGFTSTITDRILPNVVGIDIGCGVALAKLKQQKVEFQKLDTVIRDNIPAGNQIRTAGHPAFDTFALELLYCYEHIHVQRAAKSLGTLGGGNHFIELDKDSADNLYVIVHSGSRHLGKEVSEYYLKEGQKYLKKQGIQVPYELTYLEGQLMEEYIHDADIVAKFAALNRQLILSELAKKMKWKILDQYDCMHNYIDSSFLTSAAAEPASSGEESTFHGKRILRKGAISARKGEKVIIPINMRDGVILGVGTGNPDWNFSAPHGAGRIMKREDVKKKFTVSGFKKEMKGIYSSCIDKDTLDEAPFAYRKIEEITQAITDAVQIQEIIKPVYNFKAGKESKE